jgi:hypothetical protein
MRAVWCLMLLLVGSCSLPTAQDAEIGCAVDATISARCPGYVAPDAGVDAGAADAGPDAGAPDASAGGGA